MSSTLATNFLKRGTTAQCLAFLRKNHGSLEERNCLARFLEVREGTLRNWLSGEHKPYAENLIRIRYALEALGYEVVDLERVSEPARNLGRAVAFRVIGMNEIIEALHFEGENPQQSIFRILLGKCGTNLLRESAMNDLVDTRFADLRERMDAFCGEMASISSPHERPMPADTSEPLPPTRRNGILQIADFAEAFAHLVCALLPLAEFATSDDFGPKDRENLRQRAGGDGVFRLSTALNRLCGERARAYYRNSTEGGLR